MSRSLEIANGLIEASAELIHLHDQHRRRHDDAGRLANKVSELEDLILDLKAFLQQIEEQTVEGGRINKLARAAIERAGELE